MENIAQQKIEEAATAMSWKIERHIRLAIRPKPKYLPDFIWKAILKRLLVLDYLANPNPTKGEEQR